MEQDASSPFPESSSSPVRASVADSARDTPLPTGVGGSPEQLEEADATFAGVPCRRKARGDRKAVVGKGKRWGVAQPTL